MKTKLGDEVFIYKDIDDEGKLILERGYLVNNEIEVEDNGELTTNHLGNIPIHNGNLLNLKPKDILYFHKKCNVPRFKVHAYIEDKDISVTIKESKATKVIYSTETIKAMLELDGKTKYHNVFGRDWFINLYFPKSGLVFTDDDPKYLIFSSNQLRLIIEDYNSMKKPKNNHTALFCSCINTERYEQVLEILTPDSNHYHESEIIKLINVTVMDETMFKSIGDMLRSKDISTKGMAIDLMANCDFDKSIVYLTTLLIQNSEEFFKCKERSSVNFKSLLSYLGYKNPRDYTMAILVKIVRDKNLLTTENRELLLKIITKYLNGLSQIPLFIKITDVEILSEEMIGV